MKHYKVTVKWVDAYTIDGWTSLEELQKEPAGKECFTTGYLVYDRKEGVAVANTISSDGDACAVLFIPRSFIKSVEVKKYG